MKYNKLGDKDHAGDDISGEIASALSRVRKHKADGTTVDEVISAIREVESLLKKIDSSEKEIMIELMKSSIDELIKRKEIIISQTRLLLKELYGISKNILRNVKLLRLINKVLDKKLLEKRSSNTTSGSSNNP